MIYAIIFSMGFEEQLDRKSETENSLSTSIENWMWYIGNEIEDPNFNARELRAFDNNGTLDRIKKKYGEYFEKEKFKTLTDISAWVDEHPEYRNENDNCEIVLGKIGAHLVENPTEHIKEGIYFKDKFWSDGEWYKMDNSVDIVVFTHIFNKLVQALEKD
jgi:hypothetical protein